MRSLNFVAEYTIAEMESAVATAVAKGTKTGGGEETGKKKKEEDESLAAHHLPQTEQLQRTLERMQGTYKLVPSKGEKSFAVPRVFFIIVVFFLSLLLLSVETFFLSIHRRLS